MNLENWTFKNPLFFLSKNSSSTIIISFFLKRFSSAIIGVAIAEYGELNMKLCEIKGSKMKLTLGFYFKLLNIFV